MKEFTDNDYPASVVKIVDDNTVVINRGSLHGVSNHDSFMIYVIDPEEIIDPDTGENLGNLEVVKGTGFVTHVQEKLATIESNRSRPIRRSGSPLSIVAAATLGGTVEERQIIPFNNPQIGDKVKPI